MPFLLLFGDDSSGGSTESGPTLNCLVDLFFVEASATVEVKTGVFAELPDIEATAEIQGQSVVDALAELPVVGSSATMRVVGRMNCVAEAPAVFASMRARVVGWMDASLEIPCIEVSAGLGVAGNSLAAMAEIPAVSLSAEIGAASNYVFPSETDVIFKYDASRRIL